MKAFSAFKNLKIFPKLIVLFLIAIIPSFMVSFQLFRFGAESVRNEIWGSMETRVRFTVSSLDAEMERLIRLHTQYALDNDITKLSSMSAILPYYDVMQMQKRVQNKLWILETSSLYVRQAELFIPEIGKTLLSGKDIAPMTDSEIKQLQKLKKGVQSPFVYWHDKMLLSTIFPDPNYFTASPPMYILQSEIDRSSLQVYLRRMLGDTGGGSLLFNDNRDWMLEAGASPEGLRGRILEYASGQPADRPTGSGVLKLGDLTYYIVYERSELLNMTLALYMPEDNVMGPLQRYRALFRNLFGAALIAVVGFSYWIFRSIHSPIRRMVQAFRKVEKGDLSLTITHRNHDEFQYMYGQFNLMVSKLRQSVQDVYQSQIMAQQSELKQLQSQINPHFLYNTYYMVHRMARMHDLDNLERATQYLGDYFVYITRNSSSEATLGQEWNHTLAYLEIQQMRFRNRIEASIVCRTARLEEIRIPRLIFQPIVENAYQHGLQTVTENGAIALSLIEGEEGKSVVFSVENNGDPVSDEEIGAIRHKLEMASLGSPDNTGLINVHKRIRLKYGEPWGVRVSAGARGGLNVALHLPAE
ncbi:sensor histidine kinase [Paenibacillus sp. PAMC21692]|uniref:sensor histidine kinase n=1 Tax=Paenibacillus sp. PAMC21692 TaxID=2762320 RepID=UPI00164E7C63|nr:histidine kinase [Paenibacillus sp. PAMC21692]QNK58873.1 histidine kinase [Paenibacillus sp. PAMC21692]